MRQQARILILCVTLGVGSILAMGVAGGAVPASHPPIVINGDLGFTFANGVTGGSGTRPDPYIIEGWKINSTTTGTGITIKNTRDYFRIRDVDIQGARGLAVDLENVTNGSIETSQLSNNDGAVLLGSSSNITLTSNSISNNGRYGVALAYSANITLHGNIFTSDGITISPSQESELNWRSLTITPDNLVNERPVLFYNGCSGVTINREALGELMIANCANVKISNLTITNADAGIQVENVTDILIANSTLSSNLQTGLSGALVRNGTITGVTASSNGGAGIEIWGSINMTISKGNFISNHWWGIYLTPSADIYDERLATGAVNGTVVANVLSGNTGYGLDVGGAKNLRVYHNDFINNKAEDISSPSSNDAWDNGYPSGGNYWTSYTGIDRCSGPSQNDCRCVAPDFAMCPDGIGDTPFFIGQYSNWNPTDRYPLMKPYHPDTTPPVWPAGAALRTAPELGYLRPTWAWLYWNTATDDVKVTSYRIYSNNVLVATLTAWESNVQGYNATGLVPGTSYTFQVVAVDVDGNTSTVLSTTLTTPENIQTSAPNTIPEWYLIPAGVATAIAVIATSLLTRHRYRRKESPGESAYPPPIAPLST